MTNFYEPDNALPRILIVDDQLINIEALYAIFHADHEVFMATSGAQALESCEEVLPEVILLDVFMPDMDGHEVCKRLKSNPHTADIPIIFVTAQTDPEQEAAALEAGAVDFISKPINVPVVRARVRSQLTLKRQGDTLRRWALIDSLTGLANRRHFDNTLAQEWADCKRYGFPLSMIMLDVDQFKQYNDHYGHLQGDECLRTISQILKSSLGRAHDLVARYGGEEFACILPNCPFLGAKALAENIRAKLFANAIAHANSSIAPVVTVSLGVSSCIPQTDLDATELVRMADAQLYKAKVLGRNQVQSQELMKPA
jgi:diguanylate cyclase (GGDEF)-like protein